MCDEQSKPGNDFFWLIKIVSVGDLPYSRKSHHSRPKSIRPPRVFAVVLGAIKKGFIEEKKNEDKLNGDDTDTHPVDILPVSSPSNQKVGQAWPNVGCDYKHHPPQTKLSCSFVEEEDFWENCNPDNLACGEEEARHGPHGIESLEIVCNS